MRGPRWLDLRLIAGIVLVLAAVLLGAKVISAADSTKPMWAAARDLAPGTMLTADDLSTVRARLPASAGHYLPADSRITGQTVNRQLAAGELIPSAALSDAQAATTVTVPLNAGNAPKVARGERIKVWVTTKSCAAVPVLEDVAVQDVQASTGAFTSSAVQSVVVRVSNELAQRLVAALALDGAIVRAGIVDGPPDADANANLQPLDGCATNR
jgi:Chaperone for flagella basal body P-ring formation